MIVFISKEWWRLHLNARLITMLILEQHNGVVQSFSLSLMRSWICAAIWWYIHQVVHRQSGMQSKAKLFVLLSSHFVRPFGFSVLQCVCVFVCARIVKSSCWNFIFSNGSSSFLRICKQRKMERRKRISIKTTNGHPLSIYPTLSSLAICFPLFFASLFSRINSALDFFSFSFFHFYFVFLLTSFVIAVIFIF